MVSVAAFGITLPALPAGGTAFLGGLLAAGVVLGLSRAGSGPIRLVLAGSALTLALSGLSGMLLILRSQQTTGLFAWGNGSLAQTGMQSIDRLAPLALLAFAGLLLMGRRLDILALGDDGAAVVGSAPADAESRGGPRRGAGGGGRDGGGAGRLRRALRARRGPAARYVGAGAGPPSRVHPGVGARGVLVVLGADVLLRAVFGAQAGRRCRRGS